MYSFRWLKVMMWNNSSLIIATSNKLLAAVCVSQLPFPRTINTSLAYLSCSIRIYPCVIKPNYSINVMVFFVHCCVVCLLPIHTIWLDHSERTEDRNPPRVVHCTYLQDVRTHATLASTKSLRDDQRTQPRRRAARSRPVETRGSAQRRERQVVV